MNKLISDLFHHAISSKIISINCVIIIIIIFKKKRIREEGKIFIRVHLYLSSIPMYIFIRI